MEGDNQAGHEEHWPPVVARPVTVITLQHLSCTQFEGLFVQLVQIHMIHITVLYGDGFSRSHQQPVEDFTTNQCMDANPLGDSNNTQKHLTSFFLFFSHTSV